MKRAEIEGELLAWMREPEPAPDAPRFERLARALFAHQFEHCAPYARFCEARGATPARVERWQDIPAVPTGAFKEVRLCSFPTARARHVFRTSGTSTERRGELWLDSLALYHASLEPAFRRHVLPDLHAGERVRMRVLAPSAREVPDSSLSHMFATLLERLGDDASDFDVADGALDAEGLCERAQACERPLVLAGTAFAFVHWLDHLNERGLSLSLPAGSRIMETGGFKGRSRELAREAFYAELAGRLGIAPERIVNQYGMTELGSQFYDSVLSDPAGPRRKLGPPWARVRLVDPATGGDAAAGGIGMIVVHDLANTGSVAAIQTADLGRRVDPERDDGFEVLGRAEGAEARGCSLAADVMLGGNP
ncbi:MAG: long-chain fatty acid--CoA ligase [Proteobacteria bacterium]|nr:long-chain fatty acid--CoA ligase [Pseudomonadota bacterium]